MQTPTTKLAQENESLPIRIRKANEADVGFLFSSWLKSYRQAPSSRNITTTIYFTEQHKVVERLLQQCEVVVACAEGNTADIYGFACGETVGGVFVLHYIYVKHTYRQLGIGTQLLASYERNPESAAMYTHHTLSAPDLSRKFGFVYSPYIALTPDYRTPKETK